MVNHFRQNKITKVVPLYTPAFKLPNNAIECGTRIGCIFIGKYLTFLSIYGFLGKHIADIMEVLQ